MTQQSADLRFPNISTLLSCSPAVRDWKDGEGKSKWRILSQIGRCASKFFPWILFSFWVGISIAYF